MKINLSDFNYINITDRTNDLVKDVSRFLDINNKNDTKSHVLNVADTSSELAYRFKVNPEICYIAGLLHDISAVVKPEDMLIIAENNNMWLDISEKKYNFLLHQRISKLISRYYFNITDENILSSIECHTTLKANPNTYEMILFIADKISWDQEGKPPYLDIILEGLNISLEAACRNYIDYLYDNNKLLCPHKWMDEAHEYLK